jgi:hypothetical protein
LDKIGDKGFSEEETGVGKHRAHGENKFNFSDVWAAVLLVSSL